MTRVAQMVTVIPLSGSEPVFEYCHALEFLKNQVDAHEVVESTAMMTKQKPKEIVRMSQQMFKFRMDEAVTGANASKLTRVGSDKVEITGKKLDVVVEAVESDLPVSPTPGKIVMRKVSNSVVARVGKF
jgi:hypothetical protein